MNLQPFANCGGGSVCLSVSLFADCSAVDAMESSLALSIAHNCSMAANPASQSVCCCSASIERAIERAAEAIAAAAAISLSRI